MDKVFISIVNYNGNKDTLKCLSSIEKLNKKNLVLHTIVVDNKSVQPFAAKDNYKDVNLEIINSEENLGFSKAHNLAIKLALDNKADYILILNNDTELDKDFLVELLKPFKHDEKIGVTVPKIYFYKGFEFHKERYTESEKGKVIWYAGGITDWQNVIGSHKGVDEVDKGQFSRAEETDFATGCCMLVKAEVFKKLGLLNKSYFLYYEDSDFSQKVKKEKYKILFVPNSVIWHKNAGSTGGSGSELQDYYITRNRLIFGLKYAPLKAKLSLIKESLNLLLNGRKWQKKGVKDFYLRRFGKGSYGHEI